MITKILVAYPNDAFHGLQFGLIFAAFKQLFEIIMAETIKVSKQDSNKFLFKRMMFERMDYVWC